MEALQQYLTGNGKPYCSTIELGMEASKQYSSTLGMGSPLTVLINYWDVLSGLSSDRHVHHLRHVRSACLSDAAPSARWPSPVVTAVSTSLLLAVTLTSGGLLLEAISTARGLLLVFSDCLQGDIL